FDLLPGPGPFRSGGVVVAQTGIDSCIQLDKPAEEPDQIRESVEVSNDLRLYLDTALRQPNSIAFRATAYRASYLVRCRLGMFSRKRPVREYAFGRLDLMDEACQDCNIAGRDDRSIFPVLRRRCQRPSETKKIALNLFCPVA